MSFAPALLFLISNLRNSSSGISRPNRTALRRAKRLPDIAFQGKPKGVAVSNLLGWLVHRRKQKNNKTQAQAKKSTRQTRLLPFPI